MSVKYILKTLSDTELMALATEVSNPLISNVDILNQLMSKSNIEFNPEDMIGEVEQSFPEMLCLELSERLKVCYSRDFEVSNNTELVQLLVNALCDSVPNWHEDAHSRYDTAVSAFKSAGFSPTED